MMFDFLQSDAFAAIISIILGLICIWSMFKFFTKDSFLHSDTFSDLRKLTPLPPIFNYYLIKVLHVLGIIILIGCGTFTLIKMFLHF